MLKKKAARKTKRVSAGKTVGVKVKAAAKVKATAKVKTASKAKTVVKVKSAAKPKVTAKTKTMAAVKAVKPKRGGPEATQVIPAPETTLRISPERKEALRKILLEKKQEIWRDVKERLFTRMGKEYHEEVDFSLDEADKATVDLAAETGFSLIDMRKDVLDKIDRALAKLEDGTYGICEECGAEIHENRLKVVPFAIYCIECKTRQEEMEKIEREADRFSVPGQEEID